MKVSPTARGAFAASLFIAGATSAEIRFASASGAGGCLDGWANAGTLARALEGARVGDEVWVQAGIYGPFALKNGVKVIGGFAGTETRASQSNPRANLTIVDGQGARAVTSVHHAPSTMLRGFIIQNGHAEDRVGGGGLLLHNSSAMIVQCMFRNNTSATVGAAVSIAGLGSPQFINCIFFGNGSGSTATTRAGGAVFVHSGSPLFANCLFRGNRAEAGAAVFNRLGIPSIRNCTLARNAATAGRGGAVHDRTGKATIRNSVLWNNQASDGDPEIHSPSEERASVAHSNVAGGWLGTANIDANPSFKNEAGGDFEFAKDSPCRNGGRTADVTYDLADLDWDGVTIERLPIDLLGRRRRVGSSVDIGAIENQWQQRRRLER